MSKMLAFAKRYPFMLALSTIALLVGVISISSSFWSTPSEASIGTPLNFEPVVSLDQVGEDQFDMRIAEMQFEHKLGTRENPQARAEWFWQQRAYPAQQISTESFRNAISAEAERRTPQDQMETTWELAGPMPLKAQTMGTDKVTTDVSGRALAVALQPGNSNNILVGTAQGGIWQSTDEGTTFTAVADNMPSLAIKVIRFAASDTNIVYAGSGEPHGGNAIYGMGVFKSTDGGATWSALPSHGQGWDFRNVSVSGLQIDPTNPNTLYVTTADVSASLYFTSIPAHPQTGIFKSTDGGQTWTRKKDATQYQDAIYNVSGLGFMDLELSHANPEVLFATELYGGIYRSTDAGENWTMITNQASKFPASVSEYNQYNGEKNVFDKLTVQQPEGFLDFARIEISLAQSGGNIQPNDPSTYILYAGYSARLWRGEDQNPTFLTPGLIFKSTDGGTTWQWLGDWKSAGVPDYCKGQCDYDNMVEVNPSDPNDVIVGGNGNTFYTFPDPAANPTRYIYNKPWSGVVQRSLDGGQTWIDTTPICASYTPRTEEPTTLNGLPVEDCQMTQEDSSKNIIHVDVQGAAYDWANKHLYIANDGGLNRATVSGDGTNSQSDYTWETLNDHLSTLQFYDVGTHPTDPNKVFGAMQDNGTGLWNGTFWDAWPGGDGTVSQFDPKEPNYVYWGDTNSLSRHDKGGSRNSDGWTQLFKGTIGDGDSVPFVTIMEIDPVETKNIYVASNTGVYRSPDRGNQGTWQKVFSISNENIQNRVHPTTISVSPKDNNIVWVGTSNGQVHMLDIANDQQSNVTNSEFPNRYVSKIEASPNDANTVYVTFNGYDANSTATAPNGNGNGKAGKIFKSTDKGATWTNISGNMTMPNFDVPVLTLAIDPNNENNMWVGTDTGIRLTTDGGTTWVSYRHNMPPVSVVVLEYNPNTQYLTAGTHGRGIWRVQPGSAPTAITMGNLDAANGTGQTLLLSLITATMGLAAGALFLVRRRRKA